MSEDHEREVARDGDRRLMELVAEGDPRARRMLATRLVDRARRACRALLGRGPDAEDAAQQGLLAVLLSAHTYQGTGSIERWADRVVVRSCLSFARNNRKRRSMIADAADDVAGYPDPEFEGDKTLGLVDALPRSVEHYLAILPEAQREVLVLHHALGLTLAEVADATSTNVATVRYRITTALRKLRARIRREQRLPASRDAGGRSS